MKARYWVPVTVSVLLVTLCMGMARSNMPPVMAWKFLAGQRPKGDSVDEYGWSAQGEYADYTFGSYSNRDGPAYLCRMERYCFRADYATVEAAARREALSRGGVEDIALAVQSKGKLAYFSSSKDWSFFISRSARGPNGEREPSAPFVQVTVNVYRNENCLGVARRWIRGLFHPRP